MKLQDDALAVRQRGTVRWPEPISDGAPGSDQRRCACWDRSVEGFQPVALAVHEVNSKKKRQERRARAHHWIARSGGASVPRGYRSPIGLEGGSRLRISDRRAVCLSDGHRGYRKSASRPVDNDETQPLGPRARM